MNCDLDKERYLRDGTLTRGIPHEGLDKTCVLTELYTERLLTVR